MSPAERTLIARQAAHASWAQTEDRTARSAPGRIAADARFEKQVDPEGRLSPAERAKRAASARAAFYADYSGAASRPDVAAMAVRDERASLDAAVPRLRPCADHDENALAWLVCAV